MYHLINTFKALYVFNVGQVHKPPLLYHYKQPFYNNVSDVGLVGVDFFFGGHCSWDSPWGLEELTEEFGIYFDFTSGVEWRYHDRLLICFENYYFIVILVD